MKPIDHNAELLDLMPPSDIDAERAVIGAVIVDRRRASEAGAIVGPRDFYDPRNRTIFRHVSKLRAEGHDVDITLLVAALRESGQLDDAGGAAYIAEILHSLASAANAVSYANIVRDKSLKRQIRDHGIALIQGAMNGAPAVDVLLEARAGLDEISDSIDTGRKLFTKITAAELATTVYQIKFHVPGLLVAGQPQGIFGAKKSLKTSIMLDLAISIATGQPFLGYFTIEHRARVAVFSGESGMPTIQETCRRICRSAGVQLQDTGIVFCDTLPLFGNPASMAAFEKFLVEDGIELVFIDPTYLAMATDGNEGSIFAMGALLRGISELCQRIGATPVLLHHMKKGVADPYAPGDLDDASWAGFAEFCRGWMLINRREKYVPGSGLHKLWFSVGGSVGHSGLWGLDIIEGVWDGNSSRVWEVEVMKPEDVRQKAASAKDEAKEAKKVEQLERDKESIRRAIAKLPECRGTLKDIRARAGRNGQAFSIAFAELLNAGDVLTVELTKGNNRTYEGYRLADDAKDS